MHSMLHGSIFPYVYLFTQSSRISCKDVPVNSFVNIITDALTPNSAVIVYITMTRSFDNTTCIEIWTINVVHYKCTVRYDNVGHVICSIA